jgi:TRAP-type C4-dicarboxylate transport system permease small subunit
LHIDAREADQTGRSDLQGFLALPDGKPSIGGIMSFNTFVKIEKPLTFALDVFVSTCFAAILVLTILQVVLRYGLNAAILGGNEAMEHLFIYTTAIGAAIAVRRGQHIRISYFVDLLPDAVSRIVNVAALLLVAVLNGVMIYFSLPWIQKVGTNESPVMRIPEWIVQISIPVGCGLVILYCLYSAAKLFLLADEMGEVDSEC